MSRVAGQAGHVVDDVRPGFKHAARDLGLRRVDRDRHARSAWPAPSTTGSDAAQLLVERTPARRRAGSIRRRCRACRPLGGPVPGRARRRCRCRGKRPPSEKLSGVTLTMPMTRQRGPIGKSRPRRRQVCMGLFIRFARGVSFRLGTRFHHVDDLLCGLAARPVVVRSRWSRQVRGRNDAVGVTRSGIAAGATALAFPGNGSIDGSNLCRVRQDISLVAGPQIAPDDLDLIAKFHIARFAELIHRIVDLRFCTTFRTNSVSAR